MLYTMLSITEMNPVHSFISTRTHTQPTNTSSGLAALTQEAYIILFILSLMYAQKQELQCSLMRKKDKGTKIPL